MQEILIFLSANRKTSWSRLKSGNFAGALLRCFPTRQQASQKSMEKGPSSIPIEGAGALGWSCSENHLKHRNPHAVLVKDGQGWGFVALRAPCRSMVARSYDDARESRRIRAESRKYPNPRVNGIAPKAAAI